MTSRTSASQPLTLCFRLSKSRRKRPVPADWADTEAVEKFAIVSASDALSSNTRSIALNESGESAIVGGAEGNVGIFSIPDNKLITTYEAESAITDSVWYGNSPVVATSSGTVKAFGDSNASFSSHAGSANSLALHPSGDILASVGADKSFVFYDLPGSRAVSQVYTDSGRTQSCQCMITMLTGHRTHDSSVPPRWPSLRGWR